MMRLLKIMKATYYRFKFAICLLRSGASWSFIKKEITQSYYYYYWYGNNSKKSAQNINQNQGTKR